MVAVGVGGHGRSVADLLLLHKEYEQIGFVDHHAVVDHFGCFGASVSMDGSAHWGRSAWAQPGWHGVMAWVMPEKQILKPREGR